MITKSDYHYFEKARQAACISDYNRIHVGCVAVYQGKIIGIGCNANKTHPKQKYYNRYRENNGTFNNLESLLPKIHAETACLNSIRNLEIDFSKVKLYIYRIRHDQEFGISRPCPACMAAIQDLGIKDVYYTTDSGYAYERISMLRRRIRYAV